jgi:hypothetical protein
MLFCQSYVKLIEFFRNIVTSPEFRIKHRNSEKDFSRNRKIPYDPLNRISCDAIIAPVSQGERDLAVMHLAKLVAGDLVLLDRGYACLWLFDLILSI